MAVKYVSSIPEYESIDLTKKPTEIEKKFMATQDLSNEINEKKNQESLSTMDKKISKMITNPSSNPELDPIIKSNKETQKIIDDTQQRFNDYYMRLNGNITRDDAASILGGWVKKDDYKSRMDAAKQYASTQQKPDMSNLEALQKYIYDRDEARNELDRMNEQRKIDNERLGRGIGEFSAILGDIAKAHGGAPILQRDIDKQLASLNERERNAYKLYTANQQRLEQMKLNDKIREQQRQDIINLAQEKMQNDALIAAAKQAGNYKQAIDAAKIAADSRKEAAKIAADAKEDAKEGIQIDFAGKEYKLTKESAKAKLPRLYQVLREANLVPEKYLNDGGELDGLFGSGKASVDAPETSWTRLEILVKELINGTLPSNTANKIRYVLTGETGVEGKSPLKAAGQQDTTLDFSPTIWVDKITGITPEQKAKVNNGTANLYSL